MVKQTSLTNINFMSEARYDSLSTKNDSELYLTELKGNPLTDNQISDCIIENPKLVDLSLEGGVLTFEGGSTVIVPYGKSAPTFSIGDSLNGGTISDIDWSGTNLFYYVTYDVGQSKTRLVDNSNETWFISSGGDLSVYNKFSSGSTAPTGNTYMVWYDTTNNIIKVTNNGGTDWANYQSFPFAETAETTAGIQYINRIYQSIGYIGSTIWIGKGVKVLFPDGLNPDGTYRSKERTITHLIRTNSTDVVIRYITLNEDLQITVLGWNRFTRVRSSERSANTVWCWYQPDRNICLWRSADGAEWKEKGFVVIGTLTTGTPITNFRPRLPFQAVDMNTLMLGEIPTIIESWRSGQNWYDIYSNGECMQGGYYSGSSGTVNLYVDYSSGGNYMLIPVPYGSILLSGNDDLDFSCTDKQAGSFKYTYAGSNGSASGMHWFAKGKI